MGLDAHEVGCAPVKGTRSLYRRYYPVPSWTEEQALPHAVDEKCISFVADCNRIHRLAEVKLDDSAFTTADRVQASEPEPVEVLRLATTKDVEQIERDRARGRVIY